MHTREEEKTLTYPKKAHRRTYPRSCFLNATATDAKMGVSFYTSLYTDIKIHPSYEKYVLDKRNALYVSCDCVL